MFGAKRFNRISIAFSTERNSAMDRGDLVNLTPFVAVADQGAFEPPQRAWGSCPRPWAITDPQRIYE
jgi:hypothetical protein